MSTPFASGHDGYHTYRIPALTRTPGGTLIAFAEGRKNGGGDSGDIDIVCRRSTDGGATWSPQQVVTAHGGDTAGNPTIVTDPASGDLVLVSCGNAASATEANILKGLATRQVYVQRSTDAGASWSCPVDSTAHANTACMRCYAPGPGCGVAVTQGPHAGRLVIPANHSRTPAT